jgi:hypothetical protein
VQVEIDQSEVGAQPMMVLREAPVAHLVEAEDAFQYAESMFYFALTRDFVVFLLLATSST